MSSKRRSEEMNVDQDVVALRLPAPERDIIITSRHVADAGLLDRVRNAPPRQPVTFDLDELEDLHRGLAFESDETLDAKRRRIIGRVLSKIEELLDEENVEASETLGEEWDDEPPVPRSSQEIFEYAFRQPLVQTQEEPPPCRIKLTGPQREMLRGMETLSLDIHKMLDVDSHGESEIALNPRQLLVFSLAIKEGMNQCENDISARQYEELAQRISDGMFAAMEKAAENDEKQRYRASQDSPVKLAYQLKIALEHSKPPIWRRVLVADCTLDVLHHVVQAAMGWTNSHMHMFQCGEDSFSDPRFELDTEDYDETQVRLSQLVANGCKKLRYWYDFGDDWWHTITIEKSLKPKPAETFPKCVKGNGACPPEDVGGIWGYYDFLEAIRNPKHERHAELVEWWGEDFDPDGFSLEETNKALALGPLDVFEDDL